MYEIRKSLKFSTVVQPVMFSVCLYSLSSVITCLFGAFTLVIGERRQRFEVASAASGTSRLTTNTVHSLKVEDERVLALPREDLTAKLTHKLKHEKYGCYPKKCTQDTSVFKFFKV